MVVTRCPNCHARFRVSDGQLKLAAGQVRCGACLLVFDALQHRLTPRQPSPQRSPEPPPATQQPAHPAPAPAHPDAARPRASTQTPPATAASSEPVPEAPPRSPEPDAPAPPETVPTETVLPETLPPEATPPANTGAADEKANPLNGFRAEALQLNTPASAEPNPVKTSGWLLLCLLALLGLAGQALWFERAQLATYPQLRSLYALLCDQFDCTLQQPALSLIQNRELHLQPHPQFRDALRVTIVLENQAPFEQPWPALDLRFSDLKGRPVAQRTFQPDEYLDTDSLNPRQMPSGRPVQINLELASPGRRGTSYELELAPPG
ncbi:zinc-ribbon domain-containing protein [Marinobacterium sp. AK62]|uniref:Zinc-ribbon domain-containing protein n=1 Tax=Marinobacterium alkalitolerans TaxID=1542925 RepID=A0ABS3Z9W3_9GAMM|nr:zinc-ribbon domain-containing protein [Marinobacterium alkalitolerans]